ncbi:MAG: trypsin-like peptidase domain-containing protein [Polyangiaceae bacterium]
MHRRHLPLIAVTAAFAGAFFDAPAFAQQQPLPALPGVTYSSPSPAVAAPVTTVSAQPTPPPPGDIRRGIVALERDNRLVAIGTVLQGDGRIVTALSALGPSDKIDIHYSDNHVVHAKVAHRDKDWDLALVVPLSGKWIDGLSASEGDPGSSDLKVFGGMGAGKTASTPAHLRARVVAHAKDGTQLPNALELDLKAPPTSGAPIIDSTGSVVGVYVHLCKPGAPQPLSAPPPDAAATPDAPCNIMFYGAPVSALRSFLMRTPSNAVTPAPWLGMVGQADEENGTKGVRVMAIAPGSPAEKGGLKANPDKAQAHLIVAVDGKPVDSPDKLADAIGKHAVGDKVKLLVLEAGKLHDVEVALKAAP